jgi:hypothetical protein
VHDCVLLVQVLGFGEGLRFGTKVRVFVCNDVRQVQFAGSFG